MKEGFDFFVEHQDRATSARAGILITPHAIIETPVFMPVGTQATVKAMSPAELITCGSKIILANTYHLHLRPGSELIREAGGLHKFTGWNRAILTDSGGYQVFSLRDISKITEEGVIFKSHIDGSMHLFSPEKVMEIEHNLGADIIMAFDECPPANSEPNVIEKAVERTIRWAKRSAETHFSLPSYTGKYIALFGIVQGGTIYPLREKCITELKAIGF
ncbi:MAG: tRNA-guanine transglycosylase, partial [Chitinispirillaceae bacterium]|nr:tRNA-guanine transglycosylase [Chitinispirillaceae bacterium]